MKFTIATILLSGALADLHGQSVTLKHESNLRRVEEMEIYEEYEGDYSEGGDSNCFDWEWADSREDGSVIVPAGCGCPKCDLRVFQTPTAKVTKLRRTGDKLRVTNFHYEFPNQAPWPPQIKTPYTCGDIEEIGVIYGKSGFNSVFKEDESQMDAPFDTTPYFVAYTNLNCAMLSVGTPTVCYKYDGNIWTECATCDDVTCPYSSSHVTYLEYHTEPQYGEPGCVNVCDQLPGCN